ncbi:MAG: hypothetical protein HY953_03685 [Candidatus Rokubacteria bacterium]|nr:hypothetical protein [Candidatus Rokubacteria bacterium]
MRIPCLPAFVIALAAGCAGSRPPPTFEAGCTASPISPLLTCYEVQDTSPSISEGGMKVGSFLQFEVGRVSVWSDVFTWARMDVTWSAPAGLSRITGRLMGDELVLDEVSPGKVTIYEGGKVLGTAVRLEGARAREAFGRLQPLPSLECVRERTRQCLAAYAELTGRASDFATVKPETFLTTASAHGVLGIAQENLLKACKPVPEACKLPPMNVEQRDKLQALQEACETRAGQP